MAGDGNRRAVHGNLGETVEESPQSISHSTASLTRPSWYIANRLGTPVTRVRLHTGDYL